LAGCPRRGRGRWRPSARASCPPDRACRPVPAARRGSRSEAAPRPADGAGCRAPGPPPPPRRPPGRASRLRPPGPPSPRCARAPAPFRGPWRPSLLGELRRQALQRLGLVGELQPFLDGDVSLLDEPEQAGVETLHPAAVVGRGLEVPIDLEDLVLADQVGDRV